jgi:hypothetical protein
MPPMPAQYAARRQLRRCSGAATSALLVHIGRLAAPAAPTSGVET